MIVRPQIKLAKWFKLTSIIGNILNAILKVQSNLNKYFRFFTSLRPF